MRYILLCISLVGCQTVRPIGKDFSITKNFECESTYIKPELRRCEATTGGVCYIHDSGELLCKFQTRP